MTASAIIQGLLLMQPLAKHEYFIYAEHDLLIGLPISEVPEDVAVKLKELGWHEENEHWMMFT